MNPAEVHCEVEQERWLKFCLVVTEKQVAKPDDLFSLNNGRLTTSFLDSLLTATGENVQKAIRNVRLSEEEEKDFQLKEKWKSKSTGLAFKVEEEGIEELDMLEIRRLLPMFYALNYQKSVESIPLAVNEEK
ncbi:hypothetical protein Tco_0767514 [Tanacetum coccineum]